MIDNQLIAPLEQINDGLLPRLSFEDVLLLHPFPRKIPALSAELVAHVGKLLFFR